MADLLFVVGFDGTWTACELDFSILGVMAILAWALRFE